ncbi:hypothetical protein FVB9532_01433 [Mesonia oceanica]|uniref:Uncharacterized protein n=2 Tax=Flavobacteriaceae TaxID=49546 RepID=A0AC61Y6Y8_9FLAO|nr:hypothetical protein FVB9532_01433 [Mesonia oceanica]|tara:strand:- start:38714 stop:39706 length:993 start_codon:yes stop_codon:yes gene_type:complete
MNALPNINLYKKAVLIFLLLLGGQVSANPIKDTLTYSPSLLFDDCDVCGCSGNGGSMGYGTTMNKNFIGVRYIYQQYQSRDGIFRNSPWIDENFNTTQVWTRLPLGKRILVNAMLPYHFHNRAYQDGRSQKIDGLGDATLMAFYKLIQPNQDSLMLNPFKASHTLRVGGGVKMPTGEYNRSNNEGSVNPSFQVGTGSWDYTLAVDYSLSFMDWGVNALVNYTFKTENNDHYHFGDQVNYGIDAYKAFELNSSWKITPFGGFSGEVFQENEQFDQAVRDTEGDVFFGKLGVEASYERWSLGVNAMLPISQNLNGGLVEVKSRLGVYLNFNI